MFRTFTPSVLIGLILALPLFAGCHGIDTAPPYIKVPSELNAQPFRPMRVVSLDYCADQYVLKMLDPKNILAVSPDADASFSYMQDTAARLKGEGLKSVRSSAEDILILKPDLVVRAYGGGPNAQAFFEKAGVPVLNVGWAGDIAGIKRVTREMAAGLGVPARGEEIVADFERRLSSLDNQSENTLALYMTSLGVTSGPGSLVHELMETAGLTNFEQRDGWRSLPLERLAYEQPEMIAAAFFDSSSYQIDKWSAMRHPIARAQISNLPTVALNGSWMSCGAWFAINGIEALSERRYVGDDL